MRGGEGDEDPRTRRHVPVTRHKCGREISLPNIPTPLGTPSICWLSLPHTTGASPQYLHRGDLKHGREQGAISTSEPGAPRKQEALRTRTEEDCDKKWRKYNNYKQIVKLYFVIIP